LKGKDKKNVASPILSGKEVYDEVSQYKSIIFGFHFGKQKIFSVGVIYNWVKQNIFFFEVMELPYRKSTIIWMHTYKKKNMFNNIFKTVIDMKKKTKNNIKARNK
jgi:hypothetical protein